MSPIQQCVEYKGHYYSKNGEIVGTNNDPTIQWIVRDTKEEIMTVRKQIQALYRKAKKTKKKLIEESELDDTTKQALLEVV